MDNTSTRAGPRVSASDPISKVQFDPDQGVSFSKREGEEFFKLEVYAQRVYSYLRIPAKK